MTYLLRTLALLPCLAVAGLLAPQAHANTITGVAFCGLTSADASNTPAPGAAHSGTECATFTSSNISFNNYGANTLGSFINSGNLIGSVSYLNGYNASSVLDLSLFIYTGSAYFVQGQTYSATHDDGTVMAVNGTTVINAPAPTSPVTTSFVFSGLTGNYNFQYDYTEAYGGSTYVTNAANSPVPEPQSFVLLGSGVVALFGLARAGRSSELLNSHTAA